MASNSYTHGRSNYFSSGDGDDFFATDLTALGSADFDAGVGTDTLTLDWSTSTYDITYYNNSAGQHYRTYVDGYGYSYQYFSQVEVFNLYGGSGADALVGGALGDRLSGGAGRDTLTGGLGSDTITGGLGNDVIIGSAGDDINLAVYNDGLDGLVVSDLGGGAYRVLTATEGTDTLTNIQMIRLDADGTPMDVAIADILNTAPALPEDEELTVIGRAAGPLFVAGASDAEGHALTYSLSGPDAGLFAIDPVNGEISFDLAPDAEVPPSSSGDALYQLVIQASDGELSDTQTLAITVRPANAAPEATDDIATTTKETEIAVAVLDNDSDPDADPISITGFGQGTNGAVHRLGDALVYTPNAGFVGSDSFAYTITDDDEVSANAVVTVTVNDVLTRTDGTDAGNLRLWSSQTQIIAPDGTLVGLEVTYDDGSTRSISYEHEAGQLARKLVTDGDGPASGAVWQSLITTYAPDGSVFSQEFVYDDGTTRTIGFEYSDGQLQRKLVTDGDGAANSAPWSSQSLTYASDGTLVAQDLVFDDGTTRSIDLEYSDGHLLRKTMTDGEGVANSAPWASRIQTYGSDGALQSAETIYDDGTTDSVAYAYDLSGTLTQTTTTDGVGALGRSSFSSFVRSYNDEGLITEDTMIFDDATSRASYYLYDSEGRLTQKTVVDGVREAGRAGWSSMIRKYDSDEDLIELVVNLDNGDRKTVEYIDDVMRSQVYEDLVDDLQWETRTQTYDASGALIDTVFV